MAERASSNDRRGLDRIGAQNERHLVVHDWNLLEEHVTSGDRCLGQVRLGGVADDADDPLAGLAERLQHLAQRILPGKNVAASASLMMTTGSLPSRSEGRKSRPRVMGIPRVPK